MTFCKEFFARSRSNIGVYRSFFSVLYNITLLCKAHEAAYKRMIYPELLFS